MQLREHLVRDGVAGTAAAGAGRVAALQHLQARVGGEPVARGGVEVALLREADEVVHRARREGAVERQRIVPALVWRVTATVPFALTSLAGGGFTGLAAAPSAG